MSEFRYAHFCPISRAAELLGERWTLLVLRELFTGPQRFTDLRRRLGGVSTSVLSERLERLAERRLVRRRTLPPPAASDVYELAEAGRALRPALLELARWGLRFMGAPRPGDQIEPAWLELGVEALLRREPTPECGFTLRLRRAPGAEPEASVAVRGGPGGASVCPASEAVDAVITAEPLTLMSVVAGTLTPEEAMTAGALEVDGDLERVRLLPSLFDREWMTPPAASDREARP